MDFAAFAAELRGKKGPAPVYIFAGPGALLRERAGGPLAGSGPGRWAELVRLTPTAGCDPAW